VLQHPARQMTADGHAHLGKLGDHRVSLMPISA
jgi:hypothetical protein